MQEQGVEVDHSTLNRSRAEICTGTGQAHSINNSTLPINRMQLPWKQFHLKPPQHFSVTALIRRLSVGTLKVDRAEQRWEFRVPMKE